VGEAPPDDMEGGDWPAATRSGAASRSQHDYLVHRRGPADRWLSRRPVVYIGGIQNEQSVITRSNRHWVTYGGIAPPDTPIR